MSRSLSINDPWKLLYETLVIQYKINSRVQESIYLQFYMTLTLPTVVHLQPVWGIGIGRGKVV